MKYTNELDILLGDHVRLDSDMVGVVVAVISEGIYSDEYTSEDWSYLKEGVLVLSDRIGVIHYLDASNDLDFIERGRI
jgi:hypothetical protein